MVAHITEESSEVVNLHKLRLIASLKGWRARRPERRREQSLDVRRLAKYMNHWTCLFVFKASYRMRGGWVTQKLVKKKKKKSLMCNFHLKPVSWCHSLLLWCHRLDTVNRHSLPLVCGGWALWTLNLLVLPSISVRGLIARKSSWVKAEKLWRVP